VSTVLVAVCRAAIFVALVLSPEAPETLLAAMRVGSATMALFTDSDITAPA